MWKALGKRKRGPGKSWKWAAAAFGALFFIACCQNLRAGGSLPGIRRIGEYLREEVAARAWENCMMAMVGGGRDAPDLEEYVLGKIEEAFPIYAFYGTQPEYDTQIESRFTDEMIAENELESRKGGNEAGSGSGEEADGRGTGGGETEEADGQGTGGRETEEADGQGTGKTEGKGSQGTGKTEEKDSRGTGKTEEGGQGTGKTEGEGGQGAGGTEGEGGQEARRKALLGKLSDFDYLIQNFYQVDRTTTIDSSQLNAEAMLAKDMKLEGGPENVQILIYHTHSQEGYADSVPGDANTSVVAVGERLAALLRDTYGFHVMHHTGEYDVADRDNAYSYAGPALERILAENPSIEVVIDLHRDGVADTTRLVTEVNGKQTAQIMFFNGLSRTTSNGDIAYLANPNLESNLAFSFQMKLAAEEAYPGFARANYLKGYRYNLHYRPKSLLVEVGAQTNTLEEAMNAMEPLADLLHRVLSP